MIKAVVRKLLRTSPPVLFVYELREKGGPPTEAIIASDDDIWVINAPRDRDADDLDTEYARWKTQAIGATDARSRIEAYFYNRTHFWASKVFEAPDVETARRQVTETLAQVEPRPPIADFWTNKR